MSQDLLEALKDGVAVLTLNRPDRLNAMSPSMLDALLEALPRLAADPEVGVVVLTGAGRAFCSGGDVKAMAEGRFKEDLYHRFDVKVSLPPLQATSAFINPPRRP